MNDVLDKDIMQIRPRHAKGTMLRTESFGAILVGGDQPLMSLNEDALAIWKLCDGSKIVNNIKTILLQEYENEQMEDKLISFIEFCLSKEFLVHSDQEADE
jgi:hypothetical protein